MGSSPNLLAAALCTCFTQNEILASARDEVIKALPEALSLRLVWILAAPAVSGVTTLWVALYPAPGFHATPARWAGLTFMPSLI